MNRPSIGVIGGGISGLSAAFFLKQKLGDRADLTLFEKDNRLGGTIGTTRSDGYLADWGPNGFLDKEPLTLEFIRQIGLSDKLLPANDKSEKRFIFRNNRLWEISANPVKFLASGLLSLPGRLRIGCELFVPSRKNRDDESIFDFVSRRIGREAAENLIDPLVSGVYGGDPEKLSLGACFPTMEAMERDYGGLIKAMIKKKKKGANNGKKAGPAGPAGHLTSFHGGLFTLIERLEEILKPHLFHSEGVTGLQRQNSGGYVIEHAGKQHHFDHIILAVPSFAAADILQKLTPETASLLREIPYSNLAVVCHGYKISEIARPLDGFGFLVPHNQKLDILGSIWTSVIFPEQAPDGYVLFRTMIGGAKNNNIIDLGQDKLAELAHRQLASIIGISRPPSFQEVIIWRGAIPQYVLGHRRRLAVIESNLARLGQIYLAGNAYTGISLNDAIKRSYNIVETIGSTLIGDIGR